MKVLRIEWERSINNVISSFQQVLPDRDRQAPGPERAMDMALAHLELQHGVMASRDWHPDKDKIHGRHQTVTFVYI